MAPPAPPAGEATAPLSFEVFDDLSDDDSALSGPPPAPPAAGRRAASSPPPPPPPPRPPSAAARPRAPEQRGQQPAAARAPPPAAPPAAAAAAAAAAPAPPAAAAAAAAAPLEDPRGEEATERRLERYLSVVSHHPERLRVGPHLQGVMDAQRARRVKCVVASLPALSLSLLLAAPRRAALRRRPLFVARLCILATHCITPLANLLLSPPPPSNDDNNTNNTNNRKGSTTR